ncbi:MAG: ChaN family lipoprotein [Planctomycetes bacterium]|nr:ChaN family lipoprotein [Planctomycetota bacterium]
MMPRGAPVATFTLLAACAPTTFGWTGAAPPALEQYLASFADAAGTQLVERLPRDRLLQLLQRERVLWLGDHHDDPSLHARQRDLLLQLQARGVRFAFALEAIGSEDEAAVARYLGGELTLERLATLLRRRWPGSWLDDQQLDPRHYRELLAFARAHGAPVVALEPVPRLPIDERDAVIAGAVRAAAARWPDRLLVVHVGQAHLVGDGDLVARTALGGFVLGAVPPAALQQAAAGTALVPGDVHRSDGGLWWFAEQFARELSAAEASAPHWHSASAAAPARRATPRGTPRPASGS